jgi:hypothetical protein
MFGVDLAVDAVAAHGAERVVLAGLQAAHLGLPLPEDGDVAVALRDEPQRQPFAHPVMGEAVAASRT